MIRSVSVLLAASLLGASALARQDCSLPASGRPRNFSQPDGSPVELRFRGSAFRHWYEDLDGHPVVHTDAGYVYARKAADGTLEATATRVGAGDPGRLGLARHVVPAPRRERWPLAPGQEPGPRGGFLAATGSVQNLVLLLRHANHGPSGQNRTLPSVADVETILNAVGGDPLLAPTGSARDFYLESSYGAFAIDSTVVGWLDVPGDESYYADGDSGLTTKVWELIEDGLEAADPFVDFADFDADGDGWIDSITILHSGYGAEHGGTDAYGTFSVDRIWSHKWTIPTWTSDEGVKVGDYNVSAGLWDIMGSDPVRIGVIVHELGHFFGLPDLYDTGGGGLGLGHWGVMGSGAWGFDWEQLLPTPFSAWSKLKLGWAEPTTILPGAYVADQIESGPALFRIDSGYPPGEYLLIENRQPVGFDALVPAGGLAVWHIDDSKGSFTWNDVNDEPGTPATTGWPANGYHYRTALLQADGLFGLEEGDFGDAGDLFRAGFVSALTGGTLPSTDAYQAGSYLANGNRVEAIGASGASMPFSYVNHAAPSVAPVGLVAATIGAPYSTTLSHSGGTAPFTWAEVIEDPTYTVADLGATTFVASGVAQGWSGDEFSEPIDLPFSFPFFEQSYPRVWVSANGRLLFHPTDDDSTNTHGFLRNDACIAGLWDDLRTNGMPGQDVYVTMAPGSVRIRWQAETVAGALPVNVAITLKDDGRIRVDYGAGNTGLTPTVGISRGHSGDLLLVPTHDLQETLTDAGSIEFTLHGSGLPAGLKLAPDGTLSGVAIGPVGLYEFTVQVTDGAHRHDRKRIPMRVKSWLQKARRLR